MLNLGGVTVQRGGYVAVVGEDVFGLQFPVLAPDLANKFDASLLKGFGNIQSLAFVEAEFQPALNVFGGPVFALRRQLFDFATAKQRRASAAADQHAHRGLSDRGAGAEQDDGGIGDGYVPIQVFVFGFGKIEHPSVLLHPPAFLQVINVGAF